jgi:hypothetical protein
MGWRVETPWGDAKGDTPDKTAKDVKKFTENALNTVNRGVSDAGRALADATGNLGSAKYVVPGLNFAALAGDYARSEENKKRLAEAEAQAKKQSAASRQNLTVLRDRAAQLAQAYKNNLPYYQQGLVDIAMQNNRRALAERVKTQYEELAGRGIVSGGLVQGKAAKAAADARAELAGQEAEIGRSVSDQAQEFNDYVANLGLNLASMDANAQNEYYKNALENLQKKYQAYGEAGQGVGSLIGTYYGNKK